MCLNYKSGLRILILPPKVPFFWSQRWALLASIYHSCCPSLYYRFLWHWFLCFKRSFLLLLFWSQLFFCWLHHHHHHHYCRPHHHHHNCCLHHQHRHYSVVLIITIVLFIIIIIIVVLINPSSLNITHLSWEPPEMMPGVNHIDAQLVERHKSSCQIQKHEQRWQLPFRYLKYNWIT